MNIDLDNNQYAGDQNNYYSNSINYGDNSMYEFDNNPSAYSGYTYNMGTQMQMGYTANKKTKSNKQKKYEKSNRDVSQDNDIQIIDTQQLKAKSQYKPKTKNNQIYKSVKSLVKNNSIVPNQVVQAKQKSIPLGKQLKPKQITSQKQSKDLQKQSKQKSKTNLLKAQTTLNSKLPGNQQDSVPSLNRPEKLIHFSRSVIQPYINPQNQLNLSLQPYSNFASSLFATNLSSSNYGKQNHLVKQFYKNIDLGLNKESVLIMAKNKLKLNTNQINQLTEQFWWGQKNIKQIGVFFRQRGIYFVQSAKQTKGIYIGERNALDDYIKYGQCIHIVSYRSLVKLNVIQAEQVFENTSFDAYIFLCLDWRSQLVFLGTMISKANVSQYYPQNIIQILQTFFACMNGYTCNTIILDLMDVNNENESDKVIFNHSLCFKKAVKMFCQKYGCKINVVDNVGFANNRIYKQQKKLQKLNTIHEEMNKQMQKQLSNFTQQIADLLKTNQTQTQACQPFHLPSLLIKKQLPYNPILSLYNPHFSPIQYNIFNSFIGLCHKLNEVESLERKLFWIIKPYQQRPIQFTQFICSIFRFNRYLKKIAKQSTLDYRCDYRKYSNKQMYKLQRKLGPKLFNILQINYWQSKKLKLIPITPVAYQISEPISSKQLYIISQKHNSCIIHRVTFSLQHFHWICNCKRLNETGIPCRHLIAVIHKFQGSLQYYIDSRWLPGKGDKEKLKKFRKKEPTDRDNKDMKDNNE